MRYINLRLTYLLTLLTAGLVFSLAFYLVLSPVSFNYHLCIPHGSTSSCQENAGILAAWHVIPVCHPDQRPR